MKSLTALFISLTLCLFFLSLSCGVTDGDGGSLTLQLEKYSLNVGDTLKGTFTVTNLSPYPVSYRFSSSCQFEITITDGSKKYIQYPQICAAVLTALSLKTGESKQYEFQIRLFDNYDNILPEGGYTVEASLADNNSSIVSKNIIIR